MTTLAQIPNEILLQIISDVPPADLDNFTVTCKQIRNLAKDRLAEHKAFNRYRKMELRRNEPRVGQIVISSVRSLFDRFRTNKWAAYYPQHLIMTESGVSSLRSFFRLLELLPDVRKLEIHDLRGSMWNLTELATGFDARRKPAKLSEICFKGEGVVTYMTGSQEYLGSRPYSLDLFIELAKTKTLKKMQISHADILREESPLISEHCPHVEELSLLHVDMPIMALERLLRVTNKLRRLTFERFGHPGVLEPLSILSIRLVMDANVGCILEELDLTISQSTQGVEKIDHTFIGSLRLFRVLKKLRISHDTLIGNGINGPSYRPLVEILPSTLEELVLCDGALKIDDHISSLLQSIEPSHKQQLPVLHLIVLEVCDLASLVAPEVITVCQEMGVSVKEMEI